MSHFVCFIVLIALSGCASWPKTWGNQPCCFSQPPKIRQQPIAWHLVDVSVVSPLEQLLNPFEASRRLFRGPTPALNLNAQEVSDSAFFTNRDPASLSPQDVRWGPSSPDNLPTPPFIVTHLKGEGKTPGFFVKDARGSRFLFKLDPRDSPELLSGAEVVTSKLLYALGYHVPSYEIVTFSPEVLEIDPTATRRDARGLKQALVLKDIHDLVQDRLQGGRLRVSASRLLEGEILGSARFKQFRRCAEMRSLKVAYAWVNNIDAKDHNTLLVWDGTKTLGYLIDFGTSLGADAGRAGAKDTCAGWTHVIDLGVGWRELLTLGFFRATCDSQSNPISDSLGLLSPSVDPDRWKPYAPNPAFQAMTQPEARWMARRLERISKLQIEAAVSAGQYSRPEDADTLVELLESRRAGIVEHYLGYREHHQGEKL